MQVSTLTLDTFGPVAAIFPTLAQAQPGGGGGGGMLIVMTLMFAGMYFLIIAPQRKKQKQDEKMRAALKQGDRVITLGGIYGTVTSVRESTVTLRVAENVKIEFAKGSIGSKVDSAPQTEA